MSLSPQLPSSKRELVQKYLRSNLHAKAPEGAPQVTRREPGTPLPLSIAQQQVWLHAQMAPDVPIYNEPMTVHRYGPLDVNALERSLAEIIRRHEAWRTTFDTVDGQPAQIVQPAPETIHLPVVDLRDLPESSREAEAFRLAEEDARRPFDLRGPLWRAILVRLAAEEHRLFMTVHQIILDGVTAYQVFLPELEALYAAFSAGQPSPLPELPVQYGDYSLWQREWLSKGALDSQSEYWRKQLGGELTVLEWPSDRPRPAVQTFRGAMYPLSLPGSLIRPLRALSQRENVTLYQTMAAGFAALMHRYTGQEDIVVGTLTAGRRRPELEKLLGYFLNPLVLRVDASGDPTFQELVGRVRDVVIGALSHQDLPFEHLVQLIPSRRDASRNPLFQIIISLEPQMARSHGSGWNLTQFDVHSGASKVDLYLDLDERPDAVIGPITYNPDLFDAATISRMVGHWQTLLAAAAEDPGKRLSELPVLTDSERRQVVTGWNATSRPYPRSTIHGLFEAQAERSPGTLAVVMDGQQLSYQELNARSNQLARHLRKLGAGRETLAGVCLERSLDTVVALLGILKAGCAYIPLDPSYPKERLALMLTDAQPRVLLTRRSFRKQLPKGPKLVLLDKHQKAISKESGENLGEGTGPGDLAYVIYTSGSTGKPKGVQIEHRNVVNFLTSMQSEPGLSREDVLLAVTTISFDIAGLEIYLPLITGARLVLAGSEALRDGTRLASLLRQSGASVMQATPATWRMLLEAGWEGSPDLKILCGGEALPRDLARELVRRSGSVWNLYGPTETAIWSAICRVNGEGQGAVPIGRPIANTQIYLVDPHFNPVPPGTTGEIYIGGEGVSRGYLNRPELTAERFVANPFDETQRTRLYQTGDLGRYLPDGSIEFLRRADNQVKVRGFRIELGDIEAALTRHSSVKTAVCAVREVAGDPRLVAYVVARDPGAATPGTLREFLLQQLPEYMVPAHFVFLEVFPLTPNGKVDRRALSALDPAGEGERAGFVAPRDQLELRLSEIWEKTLGVTPIGVTDDFFALGGHSLLAVRLFAQIEKSFDRKFPLATLFTAATIEQQANLLRQEGKVEWSLLVPIQRSGSLSPLFCVHGHFGEVLFYRPLSQRLGSEQPFFALQAPHEKAHESIQAMAADYLAEVRKVQPHGPYNLGGYCLGALVAFEMAHQLVAQGEEVSFLGLFLGYVPSRLALRLRRHLEQRRSMGTRKKAADIVKNIAEQARSLLWRAAYGLLGRFATASSPLFRNIPELNLQAARRYVQGDVKKVYPGRMTVFLSGGLPAKMKLDPSVDLHGMDAQEIDLRPTPGDRNSMLWEPCVAELAKELKTCLDAAARKTKVSGAVSREGEAQGRADQETEPQAA